MYIWMGKKNSPVLIEITDHECCAYGEICIMDNSSQGQVAFITTNITFLDESSWLNPMNYVH